MTLHIASPLAYLPFKLRKLIYKMQQMKIGERTLIGKGFQIDFPGCVEVGADTLINYNCSFYVSNTGGGGV